MKTYLLMKTFERLLDKEVALGDEVLYSSEKRRGEVIFIENEDKKQWLCKIKDIESGNIFITTNPSDLLEIVSAKLPENWIESESYSGPDRRKFNRIKLAS